MMRMRFTVGGNGPSEELYLRSNRMLQTLLESARDKQQPQGNLFRRQAT